MGYITKRRRSIISPIILIEFIYFSFSSSIFLDSIDTKKERIKSLSFHRQRLFFFLPFSLIFLFLYVSLIFLLTISRLASIFLVFICTKAEHYAPRCSKTFRGEGDVLEGWNLVSLLLLTPRIRKRALGL